jgi:hypothetical protein
MAPRGKRKAGRKQPEPRNESGASTVAGPSRPRAPPAAAARHDDEDKDEDAMDLDEPARDGRLRGSRLRDRTPASPLSAAYVSDASSRRHGRPKQHVLVRLHAHGR